MALTDTIQMMPVVSSNVETLGYDAATRRLLVTYKGGGTYAYEDVDESVYRDALGAESVGRFLHQNVKTNYSCQKL